METTLDLCYIAVDLRDKVISLEREHSRQQAELQSLKDDLKKQQFVNEQLNLQLQDKYLDVNFDYLKDSP